MINVHVAFCISLAYLPSFFSSFRASFLSLDLSLSISFSFFLRLLSRRCAAYSPSSPSPHTLSLSLFFSFLFIFSFYLCTLSLSLFLSLPSLFLTLTTHKLVFPLPIFPPHASPTLCCFLSPLLHSLLDGCNDVYCRACRGAARSRSCAAGSALSASGRRQLRGAVAQGLHARGSARSTAQAVRQPQCRYGAERKIRETVRGRDRWPNERRDGIAGRQREHGEKRRRGR